MKLISSIRHQALLMFVSFSLGLTALYFALAVIAAFVVEDKMIFRLLQMEAQYIEQSYSDSGQLAPSRLDFVEVYESKAALPVIVQQALEQGADDNEVFTPTDDHYHFQVLNLGNGQTGYLLAEVSPLLTVTTTPQFYAFFLVGLVLSLVVGIVLAFRMASQTVKPVLEMTEAVKNHQPLPQLRYELGYLSDTMQQAIDGLSRALHREKDFTTDVNHELRTPLTILNNTVILAEQRGLNQDDLVQLRQVSNQMQHTVEVLLALAKSEAMEKQPCLLKSRTEQVVMQCAAAQGVDLAVQLRMADDFTVHANPALLDLLLTNLVNNAITHGSDSRLCIEQKDANLVFQNSSTTAVKGDITHPGVKGEQSKGIGQGLYLVTRILELLGWQYEINHADSEFSVHISL